MDELATLGDLLRRSAGDVDELDSLVQRLLTERNELIVQRNDARGTLDLVYTKVGDVMGLWRAETGEEGAEPDLLGLIDWALAREPTEGVEPVDCTGDSANCPDYDGLECHCVKEGTKI